MLIGRRVLASKLGRFRLRIRKLIRPPGSSARGRGKGTKDFGANGGFWRDLPQAHRKFQPPLSSARQGNGGRAPRIILRRGL